MTDRPQEFNRISWEGPYGLMDRKTHGPYFLPVAKPKGVRNLFSTSMFFIVIGGQ